MSNFKAIILAAGRGTRMKSETPKVLHKICGKPVLDYVLNITKSLRSLTTYVVVGHGSQKVKDAVGDGVEFVEQDRLLGTADAVNRCASFLKNYKGTILVLCGDTPLLSKEIVSSLLKHHHRAKASATVLTANIHNPHGYGRIVRDDRNEIQIIREHKDASEIEKNIKEINVGVYCFNSQDLFGILKKVKLNSNKKEFYLTDVIELLLAQGKKVSTLVTQDETVAFGINTREDLAQAQAIIRSRILSKHMLAGVTIVDPMTTFIESDVVIGQDTIIHPMTVIHADVRIGKNCSIGPMSRIRPGTRVSDEVEIGNFAEVSRTTLGRRVMQKHFSFLGDAVVGERVNIGAGVVTANYDGVHKNKTFIGAQAFIGSDAILVAPNKIGAKAMVGAGSVVAKNKNIPAGMVAVGIPARVIKKLASDIGENMGKLSVLSGNAHPSLTAEICQKLGIKQTEVFVGRFSEGEIRVHIRENIRGQDVFIVQPTCPPVNDNLMELLILIDAVRRASADRITAVIPYYGYARQDRKDQPRVPITAKLVANLIVAAGVNRVLTMDLHAAQLQGFFDIPVDHLYAINVLAEYFKERKIGDLVVVSPDVGGIKMARAYAKRLNAGLAIVDKRRISTEKTEVMHILGEVKGKNVVMVDDIIATAGSLVDAVQTLKSFGAKGIYAAASHGVLSGPAYERIAACEGLLEVVITNSIPLKEGNVNPKIKQLSVAPLLAEAIARTHNAESISSLFEEIRN